MDLYSNLVEAEQRLVALVSSIEADSYSSPTPCDRWDVRALLSHALASIDAFAAAVDGKDPRATVVREARRQRPSCRGRRGDAAEAARLAGAAARRHVPTALSAANVHLGLRTGSLVVGASRMLVG